MTREEKLEAVEKLINFISELEPGELKIIENVTEGLYLHDIDEIRKWADRFAEDDPEPENIAVDFLYNYDPDIKLGF